MKHTIDCLLVGHNEMQFDSFEKMVSLYGRKSGYYRDLNLDFIHYDGKPYSAAGLFNRLRYDEGNIRDDIGPIHIGNTFSPAIAYLGTFLNKRGLTFDFINSFQHEKEKFRSLLLNADIRAIAITTTFYLAVAPIREIIAFIKEYNKEVKIILGGPFVFNRMNMLDDPQKRFFFRTTGADIYINSTQGEEALAKVLGALKHGLPLDGISNITFYQNKRLVSTPLVAEDNKLDENMVDWELFRDHTTCFSSIRTAISCPYSCSFCNMPGREGKYQTANVESVEKELDALHRIGRTKRIYFIDDTFNVPKERFKDILRLIIRKKYNFKWISYFRSQFSDPETIDLMRESGCEGVFLGVESANAQVLKNMNKNTPVEKYREVIGLLNEYGIASYVSIIIGFPGETRETAQDTIHFIEETKPTFFNANTMFFDPHTPIWKEREKYGIEGMELEWFHSTMDSNTAADIIDSMFLSIKNSIWVPEYNFEFPGIFNLLNRGLSMEQVKSFLNAYNDCIREKLKKPENQEASAANIAKLRQACLLIS